jgi:hypothetical protein
MTRPRASRYDAVLSGAEAQQELVELPQCIGVAVGVERVEGVVGHGWHCPA